MYRPECFTVGIRAIVTFLHVRREANEKSVFEAFITMSHHIHLMDGLVCNMRKIDSRQSPHHNTAELNVPADG